eukprot:54024-Pleurochrysis_carterae.AAC.1
MHINFGDRYRSSAGTEERRVTTRHFSSHRDDVVTSASAADFDRGGAGAALTAQLRPSGPSA